MEAQLQKIGAIPDHKARTERYMELIEDKLGMGSEEPIQEIIIHLLAGEVPQAIARKAMGHLASNLRKMVSTDVFESVANFTVQKIHATNQLHSMEESDHQLRRELFEHYKAENDFSSAARALSGIQLEASSKEYSSVEAKANAVADHYVRVAETFLIEDETVDAENFVNKASGFMGDVDNPHLKLRFKVTHSKVLDANRKFLDAARNYYELSQTPSTLIKADDLLVLLGKAATCAILGRAGPQRDRILGSLVKDDRIHTLEQVEGYTSHAQVLTKMYMQHILRPTELKVFEESLMEHQKALTADGLTILQQAVIEHNMAAAFKIYDNIRFQELGNLLEIEPNRAERIAAKMISEGRLNGYLDQIDEVLYFNDDREVLNQWDERITDICVEVNKLCEQIETQYPQPSA